MLTLDDFFISSQQLELKFIITHNFVLSNYSFRYDLMYNSCNTIKCILFQCTPGTN